jgi:catecholate siderophore receptor
MAPTPARRAMQRPALQPLGAMLLAGLAPLAPMGAAAQADPQAATAAASAPASAPASGLTPASATPAATPRQLPTVRVEAQADKPEGALVSTTRVGKTLQNPQDIPQAVTSVSAAILKEQQADSLKEAMRNVAGISFNAAEGGRAGDNMNLRSFYTFGDMYLDGIRDTAQYNRETFNLEQVDVLRGAGAMLFGRGQAGGVINQVTKTPKVKNGGEVSASIGTHGYQEVKADVNGVISDDVAIRVNAMHRDDGSWRQNPVTGTQPETHREGLAASLALNQSKDSKFWVNYQKTTTRDIPDYGVSFDAATRQPGTQQYTENFFGTSKNFDNSDTEMLTLVNETRFNANQRLRTQLRQADYQRSYWAKTPSLTLTPDADSVNGGNVTRMQHYRTTTLQSDYSQNFALAGMKHEALAGLEWLKENNSRAALTNYGSTTVANPPVYRPYESTAAATTFEGNSYAAYVQDTVEFVPDWKFTAGLRRDDMSATYSSATSPKLHYGQNSYRAALSWQPDADTHYYLAYSDSFSATADLYQLTTTPQPPERSDVFELGAKWLLLNGDLALRGALYQATKDFERSTDLESTASLLTKKRRTRGLELEAAGRITPDWEVFTGLSLMNAKILEVASNTSATGVVTTGNAGFVGQRARNTPEYAFTLWTTYKVNGNWQLGAGAEAQGDRLAYQPQSATLPTLNGEFHPNTAPAYVRWDAMVHYDASTWTAKLNIKNVFNKLYYESVYDNGGFTVPGPRRTAVLTFTRRF